METEKHLLGLEAQGSEDVKPKSLRSRWTLRIVTVALASLVSSWAFRSPSLRFTVSPTLPSDFSSLHYTKLCPGLEFIGTAEFAERRTKLGQLLKGDGSAWGAYVSEPSPNTLYYTNLTASDWYTSERPWIIAITPSGASSHLSVLTPAFEKSRSQRLPFALSADDFAAVSWVTWQEAEDPYAILVEHIEELKEIDGFVEGPWTIHLEENVRQFVATGLRDAGESRVKDKPQVDLAALVVREQRMRKTKNELDLQRCAAKVTIAALRAVRPHLKVGMTEKAGEKLILSALAAAGLSHLDSIVLFGENAALPHASAGFEKTLHEGEFALFDVGGALGGYYSDYTRTMLPDAGSKFMRRAFGCHGRMSANKQQWPNARAKKIWQTVNGAQKAALASLVQANSSQIVYAADVDKAARDVISAEGWGAFFTHRVGHGIGLQVHEHPYLNSGNIQELQAGETFSNEPGVYIEQAVDTEGGGIGVRLEDMALKTAGGWELLSGEPLAESPWSP